MDISNWAREQNEKATMFWLFQSQEFRRRIEIKEFREVAMRRLLRPQRIEALETMERLLEDAERDEAILAPLARKNSAKAAAARRKQDVLQDIIVKIVKRNVNITCEELLSVIRSDTYTRHIEGVDAELIEFSQQVGGYYVSKSAKVSGLKDRLTRARKSCRLA